MATAERVARAYYAIAGVYTLSASLIWGINTLFLLRVGHLTLLQVFLADAVFTGSMAVFEVPTGMVADTKGRRFSFLLSISVLFAGTVWYAAIPTLGGGFISFCVASVVLGLGFTFYSGAVEAWVVDALNELGNTLPIDRVMARGGIISSAAMLVGTIAGGVLGSVNLAYPYVARCALLVAALLIALVSMHEIGFTPQPLALRQVPAAMLRTGRDSLRFGWNVPTARLAILAGAAPALFLEWGYHAWQPYFLGLLNSEAVWVTGVIAAAIAAAMMVGNALVERVTRFCGHRTTLLLWASVFYSVTAVAVGLTKSFWIAVPLYLVGMIATGVFQPVRQAYLHQVVSKEERATVLSLASLVSSTGSMGGQAGLGWLTARGGLAAGYVVGGAATAVAIPFLLLMRRLGGAPDNIVGEPGPYATCQALAVPGAVGAERTVAAAST